MPAMQGHTRRVVYSAVWATWADAVGFISELTDENGLRRRLAGRDRLTDAVEWKRRVGGRLGVSMTLPAGCYSDDTQLRLAVGRAVTGTGFDVEAFARVELPLWPSYALGGGRASKAAAANLAKPNTLWFANFYKGWENAGGNGVAMRIHPHVWAAPDPTSTGHLLDVVLDGITTHGHPRALLGATLHAVNLGDVLATGRVAKPSTWVNAIDRAHGVVNDLPSHSQLANIWLPSWEKATGTPFKTAWDSTAGEARDLLSAGARAIGTGTRPCDEDSVANRYEAVIGALNLRDDAVRGSGLNTVVAALALAHLAAGDPRVAGLVSARALGTDTDTIGTMAAALCGAASEAKEPPHVLDSDYIVAEAERYAAIAAGRSTRRFAYPDLLQWLAPRAQGDAFGNAGGRLAVAGLGYEISSGEVSEVARGHQWRWSQLDFGQTVLVKHRDPMRDLPPGSWPADRNVVDTGREANIVELDLPIPNATPERPHESQMSVSGELPSTRGWDENRDFTLRAGGRPVKQPTQPSTVTETPAVVALDVDVVISWARQNGLTDESLGYALRRIAEAGTVEQLVAFTSTVRSLLLARNDNT